MPQRVSIVEAAVHLRTSVDGILERVAAGVLVCDEGDDGRLLVVLPDDDTALDATTHRPMPVVTTRSTDAQPEDTGEAFRSRLKSLHARHLVEMADLQARHQAEREQAWETYRLEKERLLAANRPFGGGTNRSAGNRNSRLESKS